MEHFNKFLYLCSKNTTIFASILWDLHPARSKRDMAFLTIISCVNVPKELMCKDLPL